jgi:hypothetical protein
VRGLVHVYRPGEISIEPLFRDWGDPKDQHLAGDWYAPLPRRALNHIHPLAFEYSKWAWENVFATVKHPFDPRKATGWMERVFKSRERQEKLRRSGKTLKGTLVEEFLLAAR